MDVSPVEQLARALADTATVVGGVREDQWDAPTPCGEWDVRNVVQHLAVGHEVFTRAVRGEPVTTLPGLPEPPLARAYSSTAASLLDAFRAPGVLEGEVTVPFGTVPASVAMHLRLVEALVHGWDVAVATGQRQPYDEELAEQEIGFARTFLPRIPAGRTPFRPSVGVGEDAAPIERLAGLLGRDVGWARAGRTATDTG